MNERMNERTNEDINESVVCKAEGIEAIFEVLDSVSQCNEVIGIDESDLRDLMGNSQAAFFVEESAENVSGIKTAIANAFDKLRSVTGDEKPKKLAVKIISDDKKPLMIIDIKNILDLAASNCTKDADILWGNECSSGLGEVVKVIILMPAAS